MKRKKLWLVFYHGAKELMAYTLDGTFEGEAEDTIDLLAYENGISKESIRVACEEKKKKRRVSVTLWGNV